ncbi:hypothetical protein EHP00_310 [Ecytonucleospora hepatopenaei]|uniref:Transmembrane protein n=1 Tax=Ecytonucleospora hepatopenaei TaxID=646526 RepID=A0A1W0E7G4_9MICR|nr:hypothetical protein EHP00_310 [Ecytonucleospora hepatopenaei]
MQTNNKFRLATKEHHELNLCAHFHIILLIFKNTANAILANTQQFEKYNKIKIIVLRNIFTIFNINIFLTIGYLWSLNSLNIVGYKLINITGKWLLMLGIVYGFQLLCIYIQNKLYVNYFILSILLFIVALEITVVAKTTKLLGPMSLKNITKYTSDVKIIIAWEKRMKIETLRIIFLGFISSLFFKNLLLYLTSAVEPSSYSHMCHIFKSKLNITCKLFSFIISILIVFMLSIRLNNENKKQRKIIISLIFILIVFSIISTISYMVIHSPICFDYDFYDIFWMFFVINALFDMKDEYKTLGSGLLEVYNIKRNKIRDVNKF